MSNTTSAAPAVLNTVTSLTFDVFGTLVDWEGSVSRGMAEIYTRERNRVGTGLAVQLETGDEIWVAFTRAWRAGYWKATEAAKTQSKIPLADIETIQRQRLDELLSDPTYERLAGAFKSNEVRHELTMLWHNAAGWPDTSVGLHALKEKYTLAALANGNVRLFIDLAKNSNLPFDMIFSPDLLGAYKPNPKIYTSAAHHLRPASSPSSSSQGNPHGHIAHVAAHLYDLVAFRRACPGVRTIYVRNPTEETEVQEKVKEKSVGGGKEYGEFEVDMVVSGLDELARRLGLEDV